MKTNQGFTLLETVIVMMLSTMLLIMMEKILLQQQNNLQQQLARMAIHNKFYFAKELISKAVRTAGFSGCRNYPNLLSAEKAIQINIKPYLLITRSYKSVVNTKKDHKTYAIADCQHAEIIQPLKPWQYQYQTNAEFLMFQQSNFYLKKNSLYLQDESGKSDEVITGVDLIEVSLNKRLLIVSMILNNEKNIDASSQTLELNKHRYYFSDGKLHKLFQFNIFVRE